MLTNRERKMEGVKFLRRTFEKSKYSIYNSRNLILNANIRNSVKTYQSTTVEI